MICSGFLPSSNLSTKSSSNGTLYATLQKYFSHPRLVLYFLFPIPHIKLKLVPQTGGRLVIATQLDQSNYLASQQQVLARLCCAFYQPSCGKMLGQNRFAEPNWHVWTFLHPIFFCWATYRALVELL
jgi:hypothetical protein